MHFAKHICMLSYRNRSLAFNVAYEDTASGYTAYISSGRQLTISTQLYTNLCLSSTISHSLHFLSSWAMFEYLPVRFAGHVYIRSRQRARLSSKFWLWTKHGSSLYSVVKLLHIASFNMFSFFLSKTVWSYLFSTCLNVAYLSFVTFVQYQI